MTLTPTSPSPVNRRILLGAAWAIPTIASVSAAPALAASSGSDLSLSMDTYPSVTMIAAAAWQWVRFTVTNLGPSDTTGPINVTLHFDDPMYFVASNGDGTYPGQLSDPANWTGSEGTRSFSFRHTATLAAGGSLTFAIKYIMILGSDDLATLSLTGTVTPDNPSDDTQAPNSTVTGSITGDLSSVDWDVDPSWW